MQHTVRRNLLGLGVGVVVQRVLQLIAFLLVGSRLGVEGLGVHAKGQAVAAVLAVLAGAGVRNLVARAIARQPGAARALVLRAVRVRLAVGLTLTTVATAIAFATSPQPWFWLLWTLHTAPAAFDLKNLIDAAGRTGREVLIETLAAVLQLLGFALWWLSGDGSLPTLAAISLACRVVYALGAAATIRRLPDGEQPVFGDRGPNPVVLGQTAHELMAIGDVALVAFACGDHAAGYYAIAARLSLAALLPSSQLARLLLPHLLHAAQRGDRARTLRTALRATAWVTLPFAAGGAVVAPHLCAVSGAEFFAADGALRLLLLAGALQHLGWQLSHTLLAGGRDRAYAHGLGWPAALQAGALGVLSLLAHDDTSAPAHIATLAAAAATTAQLAYLFAGLGAACAGRALLGALPAPLLAAAACAGAAALPQPWLPLPLGVFANIAAGGVAFAVVLWWFELRGRLRRVGDGLATASGFVD